LTGSGYRLCAGDCRDRENSEKCGRSGHGVEYVPKIPKLGSARSLWLQPQTKEVSDMMTVSVKSAEEIITFRVMGTMESSHCCILLMLHVIEHLEGWRLHDAKPNFLWNVAAT